MPYLRLALAVLAAALLAVAGSELRASALGTDPAFGLVAYGAACWALSYGVAGLPRPVDRPVDRPVPSTPDRSWYEES